MACLEQSSYQQRRDSFTRSLHHFHETRGTAFKKVPELGGKEVDLFKLYNLVTERGGWLKVNRTNGWDDLLVEFDLPRECTNGGNAIKQIYLRYLDRYEKVHFLGENGDRNDDEEDVESRHRRWSARAMHTVALTYNYHQHNVSETVRRMSGLSTDLYKASEYDRLALSLVSPLPNEQDFAINVCTLLSNEGKHALKLEKCPRLLEYLLAHAGVYNHGNLRILFEEIYGRVRGHSLSTFWSEVLESPEFRDLTDENKFQARRERRLSRRRRSPTPEPPCETSGPPSSPLSPRIPPLPDSSEPLTEDACDSQSTTQPAESRLASTEEFLSQSSTIVSEADSESKISSGDSQQLPSCIQNTPQAETIDDLPPIPPADPPSTLCPASDEQVAVEPPPERESSENTETKMEVDIEVGENAVAVVEETKAPEEVPEEVVKRLQLIKEEEERLRKETEERLKKEEIERERLRIETEERLRREAIEQERIRKETEERLKREEIEAEHYEALRRASEERRRPPPRGVSSEEIAVVRERKRRPDHMGLENLRIEEEDSELFNLGRDNGTRDVIGQRILQVANILRNLSFNEEVVPLMARNTTFLRFLLLCANARWANLHQLGLDMLGNVAPELTLEDPSLDRIIQVLFGTVSRGIRHSDRFIVLSSLEVLNKVCQRDENEEVVSRNLDHMVYEQVCRLLSLHDIMVLLYTLECLYSMSSMGEKACNYICRARGAIQMLLSLITVEAQSYGPKACILMRVIETVSGGAGPSQAPPPSCPTPPPAASTVIATPQKIITPQLMRAPSPKTLLGMPMGAVATPVSVPNPCPSVVTVAAPVSTPPVGPQQVPAPAATAPPSVHLLQQHAHQQAVQENEQFAQAWVRANYELSVGGKVEQHEMYRKYVESCTKLERKGVITSMHFPRIVRSVFGGTVGPKPQAATPGGAPAQSVYDGIQVREVPLTINVKLVPVQEVPTTPASSRRRPPVSPILKAQLVSAPSSPFPAQVNPAVSAPGNAPDGALTPDMDNTSLIKSLLASKVTQRQAQAKLLQAQQQQQPSLQAGLPTVPTVPAKTPAPAAKVVRVNGVIQDTPVDSNHLPPTGKGKKEPPQPPTSGKLLRADTEDSDSMASSSREFPNITGGTQSSAEENDNSLTSFEGIFLNGIDLEAALSESSKLANKTSKPQEIVKPKSQMLADLLDKKDSPLVNGVIGEKGLELVEKAILAEKPVLVNNNGVTECSDSRTSGAVGVVERSGDNDGLKRESTQDLTDEEPNLKRVKLEPSEDASRPENGGDVKPVIKQEVNGEEEVRASSKAANLFAALAAEALEDEEVEVDQKSSVASSESRPVIIGENQPLLVAAGTGGARQILVAPQQTGQVLISAGGQLTLQKPGGATAGATQSVPVVLQNQRIVQSGGQQYIVSGNSASPMQTVLLTQTTQQQGTPAKTIIILQPQPGQPQQHQKLVLTTAQGGNVVVGRSVAESPPALVPRDVPEVSITQNGAQLHVVHAGTSGASVAPAASSANGVQHIQVISSGVQNNAPILTEKSHATLDHSVYLCEWRSCMRSFKAASDVYLHVCSCHCPVDPEQETQCLWGRCDGMKRKRFSLMTHLYDRHCNAEVLKMMATRRRQLNTSGRSEIPPPTPVPPHPGYAPNAAFHAIKRHAGDFANPKELMRTGVKPAPIPATPSSASLLAKAVTAPAPVKDDNEGPVTKSIRLTASLILRNLIIYSSIGRRFLKGYEAHLANIALSNVESSRTIAQVLADMNDSSSAATGM